MGIIPLGNNPMWKEPKVNMPVVDLRKPDIIFNYQNFKIYYVVFLQQARTNEVSFSATSDNTQTWIEKKLFSYSYII